MLYDDLVPSKGKWLCHHGIKGQKWGVRRYQNKDGSLTELGRRRYAKVISGMSQFNGMYINGRHMEGVFEMHRGYNSEKGPGSYAVTQFRNERKRQEYVDHPEHAFSSQFKKVNPMYGKQNGTTFNCAKCAAAMILSKFGFDFEAGRATGGLADAFSYWFDGARKYTYDNVDDVEDMEDGRWGTLDLRQGVNRNNGHVVNFEKQDGQYTVYDSQNGSSFISNTLRGALTDMNKYCGGIFNLDDIVRIYDFDEAEPNWDHINEDAVVRFDSTVPGAGTLYVEGDRRHYNEL